MTEGNIRDGRADTTGIMHSGGLHRKGIFGGFFFSKCVFG